MRSIKLVKLLIVPVGFISILLNDNPTRADWVIQPVGEGGEHNALALDSNNNPRISYYSKGELLYAQSDGSGWQWQIDKVDGSTCSIAGTSCENNDDCPGEETCYGEVGWDISLGIDSSDNPHISYYGMEYINQYLKYAHHDGSGWQIARLDGGICSTAGTSCVTNDDCPGGETCDGNVGRYTSLALDSDGDPHISYGDYESYDLKYIYYDSNPREWSLPQVVGKMFNSTSLALDSSNRPYISYWDYSGSYDLKCIYYNGDIWTTFQPPVPEIPSIAILSVSLVLDTSDNPHISYHFGFHDGADISDLRYAKYNGSSWSIEALDDDGSEGSYTSLALDSSGNPHICYYDDTDVALKYIYYVGSAWADPQTVNSNGIYCSITLDSNDKPHISYYDFSNKDLRYAFTGEDTDSDGIAEDVDNCPITPNGPNLGTCYTWSEMIPCTTDTDCDDLPGSCRMNQEDTYPPGGNGIGDACDCECDFDCNGAVDADDVTSFLIDFGRSPFFNPCINASPCNGDCECDTDVDSADVEKLLEDFGRSQFFNPCPACEVSNWCVYSP
jgi:hypothetical protein